jgi:hypothetical protein
MVLLLASANAASGVIQRASTISAPSCGGELALGRACEEEARIEASPASGRCQPVIEVDQIVRLDDESMLEQQIDERQGAGVQRCSVVEHRGKVERGA